MIAVEMFPDMLAGTDDYVPDVSKQVEKLRRRMQKAEGTRAKNWGDRAEKSFEKLAYDEALLRLDKAIELDEGNSLLYSSRGAAHAAVQDWGGTLDDLEACIANLDPHRQGTISQDELVALENFKDLGETFYQVPSWLHGQLREYELREKDDEVRLLFSSRLGSSFHKTLFSAACQTSLRLRTLLGNRWRRCWRRTR